MWNSSHFTKAGYYSTVDVTETRMLTNQLGPVKSTNFRRGLILEYDGFDSNFRLEDAMLFKNAC
jgi:hypothetical protein